MTKKRLLALLGVITLVITAVCNYAFKHPVSLAKFNSVNEGDSFESVVNLLGEPNYERYDGELLIVGYESKLPLWCDMEITFDNGLVCSKFHDH